MIWLALALGVLGGWVLGWYAHRGHCMRSNLGCPIWLAERARGWNPRAEIARWRWSNGNKHRGQTGPSERHPTPPATLDERGGSGVPCARRDTPSAETDLTNSKRRTP